MASAKEHIAMEVHERVAAHHDEEASKADGKADSHLNYAKLHRCLHKASGLTDQMDSPHLDFALQHESNAIMEKANAAHHREHAKLHRAAAADCRKATTADDLTKTEDSVRKIFLEMLGDTVVPSRVSAVAPTAPAGLTPIPRQGQPVPVAPPVPLGFEKLFSVQDGDNLRQ